MHQCRITEKYIAHRVSPAPRSPPIRTTYRACNPTYTMMQRSIKTASGLAASKTGWGPGARKTSARASAKNVKATNTVPA